MPRADRPRHGILREPRAPRVRALSRGRGCGPLPNQDQEPETNGIVERFHKTVLNEFYRVAFRKRIYGSIAELQEDLNEWIRSYNENRPRSRQGRWCFGKPVVFLDATPLAREKLIAA